MTVSSQRSGITVNGEAHDLSRPTSVLELVAGITGKDLGPDGTPADGSRLGIAVAVDGEVVRRGQWDGFELSPGHTVDVVTAVQGG